MYQLNEVLAKVEKTLLVRHLFQNLAELIGVGGQQDFEVFKRIRIIWT